MKQTLQLRLGQHLTMTPQLQQAIRLLQLSSLDLSQEVQEALETNPLLETEDEFQQHSDTTSGEYPSQELAGSGKEQTSSNDINNEREIQTDSASLSEELPVDSEWTDVYDSYIPNMRGATLNFCCRRVTLSRCKTTCSGK
jgi:RNA polymerase sigma-54 factor